MWKVPLFELNYDDREKRSVNDVLDSRWITMGERTQEFESPGKRGTAPDSFIPSCGPEKPVQLASCGPEKPVQLFSEKRK